MSSAIATRRESQLVVILDDDVNITDVLAEGLEREGRTVVTCNDLESAQVVVEHLKPSHVVSDVRLSGPFGFEGLDFIRFVRQHSPESRVILMTGDAPEALQLEASERGAVGFLRKPFDIAELDRAIDLLLCSTRSSSAGDAPIIRVPLLDDIITSDSLNAFFQPIVSLPDGKETLGFEALARYRDNSLLRDPQVLFQYATRKQRIEDLEMACTSRALHAGAHLTGSNTLFLNIHPHVLSNGPKIRELLIRDCQSLGIPFDRIVLEITEQGSLHAGPQLFENVGELRALGVRFAFDDLGVAYSHLPFIDKLRPSFLKISQEFGTTFERDSTKLKIVINIQSLARDFGCELILEGIEDVSTAEMAARLGIKYGQGFLFGRPADPASLGG
jgi:EAL domain-containing protein (putative c-di-GMP-specific phosphodiesterase class I)/ActR/RegA family two-component response regulator